MFSASDVAVANYVGHCTLALVYVSASLLGVGKYNRLRTGVLPELDDVFCNGAVPTVGRGPGDASRPCPRLGDLDVLRLPRHLWKGYDAVDRCTL